MNKSDEEKDQSQTGNTKDQTSAGRTKKPKANQASGKRKDQQNAGKQEGSGVNKTHETSKLIAKRSSTVKGLAKADLSVEEDSETEGSSVTLSKDSRRV